MTEYFPYVFLLGLLVVSIGWMVWQAMTSTLEAKAYRLAMSWSDQRLFRPVMTIPGDLQQRTWVLVIR